MTTTARARYKGHRFPAEIIGHAVWLYFRFPLGLRMVEELLAARGIMVSHETVRQWARKFGQRFANQIRRRLPRVGDKWHLDEVVLKIDGVRHWLWRAVDQTGVVLDVLVQRRRDNRRERQMKQFKLAGQAQRFLSAHDQINNLFNLRRDHATAAQHRASRTQTFQVWAEICIMNCQ